MPTSSPACSPSATGWARALGVGETTAALEIEHVTCTADGTPVEHSTDVFLPRSLDLHVMRYLEDQPPVPAIGKGSPLRSGR